MEENIAFKRIEDELKQHGSCAVSTVGVSMKPLFKTRRDAVVLAPISDREIEKYDVLLYTDPHGRYILHRVIKVKSDVLIIRGDNTYKKEYVSRERVIAYMTAFNRKGKHHTVGEVGYKVYSRIWNFLYPLRLPVHKFRALIRRIKRKLFK